MVSRNALIETRPAACRWAVLFLGALFHRSVFIALFIALLWLKEK
jgi:hypothetical protein